MKNWKWKKTAGKEMQQQNKTAFFGGSYSLMVTVIVLAILIAINVFVSALPSSVTKYDISSSKLYSITSNTKVVVNALDQDVTIYWIVQSGEEDEVIENLLSKYDSLSDHVQVVKKNPDVFPTFAEQYTDEEVPNNSLVVECGDKNRYVSYNDIYVQSADMYSYSYTTSFDGEGAITSAISYVTSDDYPMLYTLEGHGEADLPSTFQDQIEKDNIEIQSLSLLTVDEIPEDADAIMIYAPSSDISEEEEIMLSDYVTNGGKLLVMSGPVEDGTLENLNGLLADYNVTVTNGIVVEGDRDHYAFQAPYVLMPDMVENDLTESLIEANYYPIMPVAKGLNVGEDSGKGTVTELLATSSESFSKADGYNISTYEKEDSDTDGPFAVAVFIDTNMGGQMIWFASSSFLDDMYNAYSSGANVDLGMNAVSSLIGESEAMAIRSKSLNYNYLTISDSTSSLLKFLMIGVFSLAFLGTGIYVVFKRRRKQQ